MTAKDEVLARLGKQKQSMEMSPEDILREWRIALTTLFRQFVTWMGEVVVQDLLKVEEVPVAVKEERIGFYQAPSLKIVTPRGELVQIVPRARIVVGSFGRVDFESSGKKAMLVRPELDRWQFAHLDPAQGGWTFQDLTEETFWNTLGQLLS